MASTRPHPRARLRARARRAAVEALWRLDAALGAVLASGREPMISRIKLAWWREALERLDRERRAGRAGAPGARGPCPSGRISGAELAAMEEGWAVLLAGRGARPGRADAPMRAARGGLLFRFTARLLGGGGEQAVGRRRRGLGAGRPRPAQRQRGGCRRRRSRRRASAALPRRWPPRASAARHAGDRSPAAISTRPGRPGRRRARRRGCCGCCGIGLPDTDRFTRNCRLASRFPVT